MGIIQWPVSERPREKLIQLGPQALSDAELLAIFLRTGSRGKTAVDLARELLTIFGSLRKLLEADSQQFCQLHGLGPAKYAQLQASLEISRRHLRETISREDVLTKSTETRKYLMAKLRGQHREVFACLFLDNQHRVISFEELFHGSIDNAEVHPREVVKRALAHNAAAVIFAHNHPSGVSQPSEMDKTLTKELIKAMDLIQVRVLDHFVIGDQDISSFAELGLI